MGKISSTAMVLAAGYGMRMRPLTLVTPKPLLKVGGRAMLDHSIDKLMKAGIKRVVVNCFYLADQIEEHLASRRDVEIVVSREDSLLDTGGGIKKALQYFDNMPFFSMNADLPWFDVGDPSLERMRVMWDEQHMDALLLLMPLSKARGFGAKSDFLLNSDGTVCRHNMERPLTHVVLGAQIVKPDLFASEIDAVFSNNRIWDKAEHNHKLFGMEHAGSCYHVGTPEDLSKANALLDGVQGWAVE